MGRELLDLHLGFETAEPYPLERVEIEMEAPDGRAKGNVRALLRANKAQWRHHRWTSRRRWAACRPTLGATGLATALPWNGYWTSIQGERNLAIRTIRERFNTYRFADHKERVIDLLRRVCTVSVGDDGRGG